LTQPLIKPDVRIARIQLSDWLHLRLTDEAPTPAIGVFIVLLPTVLRPARASAISV
jgi:hypothetical protein